MNTDPIKAEQLATLSAFREMTQEQLGVLAPLMIKRSFQPGQLIFLEGELVRGLWFILSGNVKIMKQSRSGRLQGLCLVNRGKCFGSCPLFDTDTNPADAVAFDEVTLAILPREEFRDIMRKDADLSLKLVHIYSERLELLARLGESLGNWTVAERINDCLIAYADESSKIPTVSLTHAEIATLVGTAREVVTRHLVELEEANVTRSKPGEIMLLDMESLASPCLIKSP